MLDPGCVPPVSFADRPRGRFRNVGDHHGGMSRARTPCLHSAGDAPRLEGATGGELDVERIGDNLLAVGGPEMGVVSLPEPPVELTEGEEDADDDRDRVRAAGCCDVAGVGMGYSYVLLHSYLLVRPSAGCGRGAHAAPGLVGVLGVKQGDQSETGFP